MRRLRAVAVAAAMVGLVVGLAPAAVADTATWTVDDVPPPGSHMSGSLVHISCATATYCVAVGVTGKSPMANVGFGTSWTWNTGPLPAGSTSASFADVSCVSTTYCMAVGVSTPTRSLAEEWNGSAWTVRSSPLNTAVLAVSCVSPQFCMATTARAPEKWNGSKWAALPAWPTMAAADVSCSSPTRCLAVGRSTVRSHRASAFAWDGTQWTDVTPSGFGLRTELSAVDCIGRTCVVGGSRNSSSGYHAFVGKYVGTHWQDIQTVSASTDQINQLSCRTDGSCVSVGVSYVGPDSVAVDVMSGSTWTPARHIPGTIGFGSNGIDCRVTPTCVAAAGNLFNRTAGGGWTDGNAVGPIVANADSVNDISCASSFCAAVLGGAYVSQWDGTTWTTGPLPGVHGSSDALAVSCSSAVSCVAIGMVGLQPTSWLWNGSSWAALRMLANNGTVPTAVSCDSATDCLAVGQQVGSAGLAASVEHFDGQAWSVVAPPFAGNSSLNSVSCLSSTFCAATGSFSSGGPPTYNVSIWNGSTWTVTDFTGFIPTVISCATATFCIAAGTANGIVSSQRYDGVSWSPVSVPGQTSPLVLDVSCVSVSSCVLVNGAVDGGAPGPASAATWDGSTWTATTPTTPPNATNGFGLSSVSCASTFCRAAGFQKGSQPEPLVETLN